MRLAWGWLVLQVACASHLEAQEWWPRTIELGQVEAGTIVSGQAWFVDLGAGGAASAELAAETTALELVEDRSSSLGAGAARSVRWSVRAPDRYGEWLDVGLVARLADAEPVLLPLRLQAAEPAMAHPREPLRALEGRELTVLAPRLVRLAPTESELLHGFVLRAGGVERLDLRVEGAAEPGATRAQRFVVGAAPTLSIETVDPRVLAIERTFEARKLHDDEASQRAWAEDARLWFETREGEGTARDPGGGGPWTAWDGELSKVIVLESCTWNEAEGAVDVVVRERNDYYRLLERLSAPYLLRYWLDDELRIAGRLVTSLPDAPERRADRFEEFRAWAERNRADELAVVWPGEVVPSAENARRFRELLVEWRAATGQREVLRVAR